MAIGIDNVYQQVLAIANKEQRGYITPQEFNLFARKAQNDIFEKTFLEYKDAFLNPTSVMQSHKSLGMLREKINPFRRHDQSVHINSTTGAGVISQLGVQELTDTDDFGSWVTGTGWTVTAANNEVACDGSATADSILRSADSISSNQFYQVDFTIKGGTTGTLTVKLNGTAIGTVNAEGGHADGVNEYSFSGKSGTTADKVEFVADKDFIGTLRDPSVRKVTDSQAQEVYWIESVYYFDSSENGKDSCVFEEIDKKRVNFLEKYKGQTGFPLNIDHLIFDEENGLKFSTINTYYREGTDKLVFYPIPRKNPTDGSIGDVITPKCDYIRTISSMEDPKWAFTVVNGKALYDSSQSHGFEIHSSEEGNLINKILEMAGISMGKPDLTQSALLNQSTNMQQQVQKSYMDNIDNERSSFVQDQFPYGNKNQQPPRR